MTISRINSTYSYANQSNRIKPMSNDIEISQVNEVNRLVEQESVGSQPQDFSQESEKPKASKIANLENFVFDFKKDNEYNLVGAQSKLEDVDVAKALSDMKKDSVLDQYKFFVKSSLVNDGDGSVRQVRRG